jgi:hypothetical protein
VHTKSIVSIVGPEYAENEIHLMGDPIVQDMTHGCARNTDAQLLNSDGDANGDFMMAALRVYQDRGGRDAQHIGSVSAAILRLRALPVSEWPAPRPRPAVTPDAPADAPEVDAGPRPAFTLPARTGGPAEHRAAAIGAVLHTFILDDGSHQFDGRRTEAAEAIESLAGLGRTARWQRAIKDWANAVRTASNGHWALVQFSVYAGYANI